MRSTMWWSVNSKRISNFSYLLSNYATTVNSNYCIHKATLTSCISVDQASNGDTQPLVVATVKLHLKFLQIIVRGLH